MTTPLTRRGEISRSPLTIGCDGAERPPLPLLAPPPPPGGLIVLGPDTIRIELVAPAEIARVNPFN
jgi:hypothetical protein